MGWSGGLALLALALSIVAIVLVCVRWCRQGSSKSSSCGSSSSSCGPWKCATGPTGPEMGYGTLAFGPDDGSAFAASNGTGSNGVGSLMTYGMLSNVAVASFDAAAPSIAI